MAETKAKAAPAEEVEEASAEPTYVTVEYVGEPPYGREFISSHTIQKSSATPGHKSERLSFAGQGIEVPEDLVWNAANGYKLRINAELTDLVEGLRAQPFLKVSE